MWRHHSARYRRMSLQRSKNVDGEVEMAVTWGRQKRIFKGGRKRPIEPATILWGPTLNKTLGMDEGQDQGRWNACLQECLFQKNSPQRCTHVLILALQEAIFLYHRWWNHSVCKLVFFFFPLRRESYSKIWSEIVNLLTLKSMQDMITSYFQQNYKGESMCYITRGNSNKQSTQCSDSHGWRRWLRNSNLCYFIHVMRMTVSGFFLFSCLWRLLI